MPPGCQDPANAALSPSGASSTRRARHPHVCISTACTALTDPICKQTPLRLDTLNLNVVLRGGGVRLGTSIGVSAGGHVSGDT